MNKYKAVLFDCDGTVSDSRPGIFNSIYYAIDKKGIAPVPEEQLQYFLGPPLYLSFAHIFGVSEDMAVELTDTYREYYNGKGVFETTPYEGIEDVLASLKEAGIRTAIVSSKPVEFLEMVIPHLGLSEYFDFIVGPPMDNHNASKEILVRTALELLELEPSEEIAMVGDRRFDIEAAGKTGVTGIGITYGYGTEEELRNAGADIIAKSTSELKKYLLTKT